MDCQEKSSRRVGSSPVQCSPLLLLSCYPILSKETCPGQQNPAESFDMAKFFCLHLFLALASGQWWGLQRGFPPRLPSVGISPLGRIGAQRGIGVSKQPAAGYYRASTGNFFGVSELLISCLCNNFTDMTSL